MLNEKSNLQKDICRSMSFMQIFKIAKANHIYSFGLHELCSENIKLNSNDSHKHHE